MGNPRTPDETPAELVNALSRRMRHAWRAAAGGGPAPHHARALAIVCRRDGVRPGALADRLRIAPRSATDVVDALEARGLVRRVDDPTDRRACLVEATPAGQEVYAAVRRDRARLGDALFDVLSADERRDLAALLRRVLDASEAGGEPGRP